MNHALEITPCSCIASCLGCDGEAEPPKPIMALSVGAWFITP